ncbi:MAG: thiamine pyrophosphate-dependent enzyme [Anaerolineae bacterium]
MRNFTPTIVKKTAGNGGNGHNQLFDLIDYQAEAVPRWCVGCGDHTVLTTMQRLLRDRQIPPEKAVFVSGIGCSSRFPHYMSTYGFHGIHGRAIPIATGLALARPDLHIFVVSGDGDCLSIGAGHWIHGVRYNVNITVLLFDNEIYGLTKKQTSPTTNLGYQTNTQPQGSYLPPMRPITTTLGVANASFVARTVDWYPRHLYDTLSSAVDHQGLGFVQILQRCPVFNDVAYAPLRSNPESVVFLSHERGIPIDERLAKKGGDVIEHDPADLDAAFALSRREEPIPIGLFYRNPDAPRYDLIRHNEVAAARGNGRQKSINALLARYQIDAN